MTDQTPSPQSVVVPVEPCPFCGSGKAMATYVRDGKRVHCPCGASGAAAFHGRADQPSAEVRAVGAWNLRAAPAPSSLAGGEVMNDDAPTYMRLAQALSRHPEVMVVERSDPTLELTSDSLEHLLEDVFPLAALSPEAPTRIETPIDTLVKALTPRHEAPAEDEARRKLIQCIEQWDGETEYDADDLASLADGILHAFNGPPVVSRAAPVELSSNPCQLEAPAEGAGERERLADAYIAGAMSVHEYWTENPGEAPRGDPEFDEAAGDYAYSILSDLRARSSAPEAREGEAVAWLVGEGGGTIMTRATAWVVGKRAQGVSVTPLYTHPAPDALRVAVEALEASDQCIRDLVEVYANGGSMAVLDLAVSSLKNDAAPKVREALAALQAEQGRSDG